MRTFLTTPSISRRAALRALAVVIAFAGIGAPRAAAPERDHGWMKTYLPDGRVVHIPYVVAPNP